jgi:hypothetical protein
MRPWRRPKPRVQHQDAAGCDRAEAFDARQARS